MSENIQFSTDIKQLLNLIINSLYTNKEIFLRELISNASDAIDKKKTNPLSVDATVFSPQIKIFPDHASKLLVVADNGVGMSFDDMKANLGTIAKSGTKAFVDKLNSQGAQSSLIGQFGVGFYSSFLVSNKVSVLSSITNTEGQQEYAMWSSNAKSVFNIDRMLRGDFEHLVKLSTQGFREAQPIYDVDNPPSSCTFIIMNIKQDCLQYLQDERVFQLIKRHSDFIQHPIYIANTVTEEIKSNSQIPLWCKEKKDIKEEEYKSLYKALCGDAQDYLRKVHFDVEGSTSFKSILFIPQPQSFSFQQDIIAKNNVKLYSKKVFITDDLKEEVMPEYLQFIRGIIDSDDLKLNVSREFLQQSMAMKSIKKTVMKKVFSVLQEMQNDLLSGTDNSYLSFYAGYGKNLKLGVCHDEENRKPLLDLLIFASSNGAASSNSILYCNLKQYVKRMRPQQKDIYFVTGQSIGSCASSPFIDNLVKRGYEVLYMDETIDEHMMQAVNHYEGRSFVDCSKQWSGDFMPQKELHAIDKINKTGSKFLACLKRTIQQYYPDLESAKFGVRTVTYPAVITSSIFSWSANMERMMKSQVLGDTPHFNTMQSRRHLELNEQHAIVQQLARAFGDRVKCIQNTDEIGSAPENENSQIFVGDDANRAVFLYESALLHSGYDVNCMSNYIAKVYSLSH